MRIKDGLFVELIDFPSTKINSCITKNDDDTYTIFINAKLDKAKQLRSLFHEIKHFKNNDFSNVENVSILEANI